MQFDHHLYCAEAHSGGDKVRRAEGEISNPIKLIYCQLLLFLDYSPKI